MKPTSTPDRPDLTRPYASWLFAMLNKQHDMAFSIFYAEKEDGSTPIEEVNYKIRLNWALVRWVEERIWDVKPQV